MKRFGQLIGVKPEKFEEYTKYHAAVWPEILSMISACNIRNYSIFHKDGLLFAYFEYVGEDFDADMAKMAADPKAGMYEHPATQANVRILQERGVIFVGPAQGRMASGLEGRGRFVEPAEILGRIRLALARGGRLAGRRLVVTAGGTQEPIDPVRYITNRSSGKQGYAIAQAALDAGAQVTLVTHPTGLIPPVGAEVVEVRAAQEMQEAVLGACEKADGLVMAAAVADFRVKNVAGHKLKKRDGIPQIELVAAADILGAVARARGGILNHLKVVVGFAAESRDLIENAVAKLTSKQLDFIAANDISATDAGFAVDTNRITLLFADGRREALPLMGKDEVAAAIIERVADILEK